MSGQNRDINIRVKVQDDGTVTLQTIGSQGKRSLEEIDRQGQRTNDTMQTMNGIVGTLTAGFSALAAVNVAKSFIDTASAFEKLEIRLTTIQGSSSAAKHSLAWITVFTAKTPYELDQVSDAFVKLNAYGFDAVRWLPMLGDTASSMGKELNDAVEMFADATTGEFERLKEFGVRAKQEGDRVSFSWIENGKQMQLSTEKTQAGISEALAQVFARFEGGMQDQASSWEGMTSNMADAWTAFKLDVMSDGVFEELKGGLDEVLQTAKRLKDDGTLKEWADGITDAIFRTEAEAIRLSMLLDKIGGTMTMIPMGIFAPGAALGNANSIAQFEKWAQRNADLEARYNAGDQALQELAARQVAAQGQAATAVNTTTAAIVAQTTATGEATKQTKQQIKDAEKAKKAAEDHGKYLDQLTAKYLPLKVEMAEVSQAEKGLAELRAKRIITAAEYAQAMDNLAASTTKGKQATDAADQADKARHETWRESQDMLEELTATTMTDHEQAVARIEEKYVNLDDAIRQLVLSGQRSHEWAAKMRNDLAIAQGIDLARADTEINSFVGKHEAGAGEVRTVWDSAMDGIKAGEDEWVRNGAISVDSMVDIFGSGIRRIVADWLNGVATMNANSPQMKSIGGTAALMATMAGSGTGYAGLLSGGVGIVNELFNPGSYAASLSSLQNGISGAVGGMLGGTGGGTASAAMLAENFGAGAPGASGVIQGMSPAAFGAATAGLGTFVMGLAQGKNVGQAATSGAGAAGGAYIGTMILPGVGTIVGSMLGSFLGDSLGSSLFGGDDEWVRSKITGLTFQGDDFNYGDDGKYATLMNSAEETIKGYVAQFPAQIQGEVVAAFSKAWGSKDFNSGKEGSWEEVASELATWMQTSINQAMGLAVLEVVGKDILTEEAMAQLTAKAAAGQDLTQYLNGLLAITTQLDQAVDNNGVSAYQLELQAIDQQYAALGSQLRAYGVDLDRYTTLEKAHAMAIGEANKKEEERLVLIRQQTKPDDIPGLSSGIMEDITELKGLRATKDSAYQHAQELNPTWGWDDKYANGGYQAYPEIMASIDAQDNYEKKLHSVLDNVPQTLAEVTGMVNALTPVDDAGVANVKKMANILTAAQDLTTISTQDIYGNMVGWNATTDAQVGEIQSGAQQLSTLAGGALTTAINDLMVPVSDTIASHTGTGYQQGLTAIAKWQQDEIDKLVAVRDQMTETDYTSWMDSIHEAARYKTQDLIDQFITPVIKSWEEFMAAIAISDQSPYDINTRYRMGKDEIAALAEQAKGGDLEASSKLQAAAQEWLGISRQINTSALAYGADLGWLQSLIDPILATLPTAAAQPAPAPEMDVDATLARIPAPQVTPLPTTSISSEPLARGSRAGGDTETKQELASLRTEVAGLKEALLAIANNTQAAASVLKRWDTNGPSNQDTAILVI